MSLSELILLFLAYSIGLVTMIIQVICYRKKMENLETIVFAGSFLLLIVLLTVQGLSSFFSKEMAQQLDPILSWALLLLGLTTALNIHREREISFRRLANTYLYGIFGIAGGIVLVLQLIGKMDLAESIAMSAMILAIAWGMGLVLLTVPSMMIRHRNRIERYTSWGFFAMVLIINCMGLAEHYFPEAGILVPDSPYLLALIFIFLCVNKVWDDLRRLSLLSGSQQLNPHAVSRLRISPREQEVMALLITGKSYQQIADELFISLPTVKTHVSNIYRKTEVRNKVELINQLQSLS